ncbi:3'-5' exonuclease [Arenibacter certesii]|uniref:DNA polymerase III subunit epsilon n=1 Tax=Arenibacter certesii TaxID=228955 RepID=A0A918J1Z3_9FLAO|nr:3'-5' exonuclease [Arenibacter certesii]GGW41465.1 DNA polymerase III subunit epsilon [Arenibacter certesii]
MINIFRRKPVQYPKFWEDYAQSFEQKLPTDLNEIRFVVLDTETTGFDYIHDRILSIGALTLQNKMIEVSRNLELYLEQDHHNADSIKIHGILKSEAIYRISEEDALQQLLAYLQNAVIIAHHAVFDLNMINKALERNGLPKLKNPAIDTSNLYKHTLLTTNLVKKKDHYSLDELADKFDISKKDRHTAMGDAYITAIAFLKIKSRLKEKDSLKLKDLLKMG